MKKRLVVGMSGASGAIYGITLLRALHEHPEVETHLVMTKAAERTVAEETDWRVDDVKALAAVVYPIADVGGAVASGSFRTAGMVIAPCSINTLGAVAYCQTSNLLVRAADVMLKERRKLIMLVRETPLHRGHLAAMTLATEAGAVVMPPAPAFYRRPKTVEDIVNHTVGRMLDHFDIDHALLHRWGEPAPLKSQEGAG